MFGGKKRAERRLEEAGQTARATVVTLHRGGTWWVNGAHGTPDVQRTNCRVTLEVQPAGEPSFQTELKTHFRTDSIPSEGDLLDVVYDPADHDNVEVATGSGHGGNVQVQVVRAGGTDPSRPMPTVTINGQVVSGGGSALTGAAAATDVADEIAKLGDLRDRGLLTDAEFQAQKQKLLDRL
jgi:hypothetical protein